MHNLIDAFKEFRDKLESMGIDGPYALVLEEGAWRYAFAEANGRTAEPDQNCFEIEGIVIIRCDQ